MAAAIAPARRLTAEELARHGIPVAERAATSVAPLGPEALERAAYEDGRPSEDDAWGHGDARFLPESA